MDAKKVKEFTIIFEGSDEDGWCAIAPDVWGLLMMGESREEIIAKAPELIEDYIEAQRESNLPIPEPGVESVEEFLESFYPGKDPASLNGLTAVVRVAA